MKTLDVVAAIIERDGKILLAQRPQHADQSGMWEFAGGKVEPGKVSQRRWSVNCVKSWASRRSLGATLPAINARFQADSFTYMPGMYRHIRELKVYEHQDIVWCSPEEALRYPLAPADIPLLEAFILLRDARPADSC